MPVLCKVHVCRHYLTEMLPKPPQAVVLVGCLYPKGAFMITLHCSASSPCVIKADSLLPCARQPALVALSSELSCQCTVLLSIKSLLELHCDVADCESSQMHSCMTS